MWFICFLQLVLVSFEALNEATPSIRVPIPVYSTTRLINFIFLFICLFIHYSTVSYFFIFHKYCHFCIYLHLHQYFCISCCLYWWPNSNLCFKFWQTPEYRLIFNVYFFYYKSYLTYAYRSGRQNWLITLCIYWWLNPQEEQISEYTHFWTASHLI